MRIARDHHRGLAIAKRGHALHRRRVLGQVDHVIGQAARIQGTGRRGALHAGGFGINGDGHAHCSFVLDKRRRHGRRGHPAGHSAGPLPGVISVLACSGPLPIACRARQSVAIRDFPDQKDGNPPCRNGNRKTASRPQDIDTNILKSSTYGYRLTGDSVPPFRHMSPNCRTGFFWKPGLPQDCPAMSQSRDTRSQSGHGQVAIALICTP